MTSHTASLDPPEPRASEAHFADAVVSGVRRLGYPLCLGLDPHLDLIPPLFRRGSMASSDPLTVEAVADFLRAILERAASRVAVVKPQAAFFEQLGWRGVRCLEKVIRQARELGLPVLLDAKRGDIGSTATAYGKAYLSADAPCRADAMTVQPYLGMDALEPFLDYLPQGRGLFVLVKTSNPGSADFQDRPLASGGSLFEAVAGALAEPAAAARGPRTGWSSLGVVVGAKHRRAAERVREILPHSLFLVPGYGAQGGAAAEAVRGFVAGPEGRLEGGLVSSSRGLLFPPGSRTDSSTAWDQAVDEAFDRAADELGSSIVF